MEKSQLTNHLMLTTQQQDKFYEILNSGQKDSEDKAYEFYRESNKENTRKEYEQHGESVRGWEPNKSRGE